MTLEAGSRRGFLTGALALVAAPVVVKATSLMKVAPTEVLRLPCRLKGSLTLEELTRRWSDNMDMRAALLEQQVADAVFAKSDEANGWQWPEYDLGEAKIGSQLRIRLPSDFKVTDGPSLVAERYVYDKSRRTLERQVPLDVSAGYEYQPTKWIRPADQFAVAAALAVAAPVVVSKVLDKPVTRRFFG